MSEFCCDYIKPIASSHWTAVPCCPQCEAVRHPPNPAWRLFAYRLREAIFLFREPMGRRTLGATRAFFAPYKAQARPRARLRAPGRRGERLPPHTYTYTHHRLIVYPVVYPQANSTGNQRGQIADKCLILWVRSTATQPIAG